MPLFTRKPKTKTYGVRLAAGSVNNIFYCFLSRDLASASGITDTDLSSQLGFFGGNVPLPAGAIQVFGCNAPKPPRVKKRIPATAGQGASLSTFCAPGSLVTARTEGWKVINRGRQVRGISTSRTVTVVAEMSNTILYAFNLNKADFELYGQTLGLTAFSTGGDSATEKARLVSGTSRPRPARASISDSATGSTFSTFCSNSAISALTTAGWEVSSEILE